MFGVLLSVLVCLCSVHVCFGNAIPTSTSNPQLEVLKNETVVDGLILALLQPHLLPKDTPITALQNERAFNGLSVSEKLYAHHFSGASWLGFAINLLQTSPESPFIFLVLHRVFRQKPISQLETLSKQHCQFSTKDWDAFLFYATAFYFQHGNHNNRGGLKFIPDLDKQKLSCFVQKVADMEEVGSVKAPLQTLWNLTAEPIFNISGRTRFFGLAPDGVTGYFSSNCDESDAENVREFMKEIKMEAWNSRVFKRVLANGTKEYEIRLASVLLVNDTVDGIRLGLPVEMNGSMFVVTRGDYSPILRRIVDKMAMAKNFAANDNQKLMISEYIESITTGSVARHKNGSLFWVADKEPNVESSIGFIETYQDPDHNRGSFEGLVAVVDKEKSKRLKNLVANAPKTLPLLPWPKELEGDTFLKPDFTDLTAITAANIMIPMGINLPNYEEIRQNKGFKNLVLGNVIEANSAVIPLLFLSRADTDLLRKHMSVKNGLQGALHELFGHGSGKLLMEYANGTRNFDVESVGNVSPFGRVTTWYKPGETCQSKFNTLYNNFEECRAEAVACYLVLFPELLQVWFGEDRSLVDVIPYLMWLDMARNGLHGLAHYNPETGIWGQAHSAGRHAILRVMLEAGVASVDIVNGSDGQPDLLLRVNQTSIHSIGKKSLGNFLHGLQFYRATGDVENARKYFDRYTRFTGPSGEEVLQWAKIARTKRPLNPMFVQPNTKMSRSAGNSSVEEVRLKSYSGDTAGMIESFKERFSAETGLEDEIYDLAIKDLHHFLI